MDNFPIFALALTSAFIYGVSHIFAKMSLEHLHPVVVAAIFTLVNLLVAAPIGFAKVPFETYRWEAILSFTLMGVVGYAGLRLLFAIGIHLLGVSRHAPVAGVYPLLAAFGALFVFGERSSIGLWAGTAIIVSGIIWLGHAEGGEKWERKHLILPLLQAVFRAIGIIFRKLGLLYMNAPMFAIAVAGFSGSACLIGYIWINRKDEELWRFNINGFLFAVFLGLTNLLAQYLYTLALSRSDISYVIPIISTAPLFTILFTKIFLRSIEIVGRETILGGALVVFGTIIITMTRPN